MKRPPSLRISTAVVIALGAFQLAAGAAAPATAPAASSTNLSTNSAAAPLPPEIARMLQELQDQQRANARAIDLLRELTTAARQEGEIAGARLKIIEYTLTEARQAELAAMRNDNRHTIAVVAAIASVGVTGMFLLAIFLFRAIRRVGDVNGRLALAPAGEMNQRPVMLTGEPAEQQMRVIGVMDQLEKRVKELEATIERRALPNGAPEPKPSAAANGPAPQLSATDAEEITALMAKGQALLTAGNPAEALDCFDAVLRFDPTNTDALIKQGKALEKLRRFDEALESFDRALAADGSLTVAYLSKGGVLNRLERFDEALHCYEQALRTQQHGDGGVVTGPIVVRE